MTDWIEWKGGDQPVEDGTIVEFKLRINENISYTGNACRLFWHHDGREDDIIAYRIISEDEDNG